MRRCALLEPVNLGSGQHARFFSARSEAKYGAQYDLAFGGGRGIRTARQRQRLSKQRRAEIANGRGEIGAVEDIVGDQLKANRIQRLPGLFVY